MARKTRGLNFSRYPAIDHHCHPWSDATKILTKEAFLGMMNFGGFSDEDSSSHENNLHAEFAPMGRQLIHWLAKFLGSSPTLAATLEARNKRARRDYWKYSTELLEDASIEGLLVDDGYSELAVGKALTKKNFDDFQEHCPVKTKRVSRLEPLYQDAIDASKNFEDFVEKFDEAVTNACRIDKAVAFKSIIAYRSGLSIQRPNEADVKKDYEISKATRARNVKSIRDWYVHRIIKRAPELGVTVHLHTGIGDIDVLLKQCNPAQLYDLLKEPETLKTKIFLIHAGYPFCHESGYLANALKNVYIDLSVLVPFATIPVAVEGMLQLLDQAPAPRLLYGSDGYDIPEIHWAGAKIGRKVLQEALARLVGSRSLDEDEAHQVAKFILADNAKRIYKF